MARTFDGTDDEVVCSTGALSSLTGANVTVVAVMRRNVNSAWHGIWSMNDSVDGYSGWGLLLTDTGKPYIQNDGAGPSSMSVTTSDGWVVIGYSKAAGTATPRFHKYGYAANSWSHVNGDTTQADGSAGGASGKAKFGTYNGGADRLNGDIVMAGVWNSVLSDGQIETLAHSLQAWCSLAPSAMWVLDQQWIANATQILVPTSTQAAGSWTPATNPHLNIDDNSVSNPTGDGNTATSDAVGNNTNSTNLDLKIASGSDPGVNTGHIIRTRWSRSGTASLQAHCELWQGVPGTGTQIASLDSAADVGGTEVEATLTLTGTQADNITDYADLYLRLWGRGTGGGAARSLIVELAEFQVPGSSFVVNDLTGGGANQTAITGTSVATNSAPIGYGFEVAVPHGHVEAGTNAPAEAASATGTAEAPTRTVSTGSQASSGTGTANNPSPSVRASSGAAEGTGTANNATIQTTGGTNAQAEVATATGTAETPTRTVSSAIGSAAATGVGQDATATISPTPTTATGTGTANNATVQTGSFVNAQAGVATGTGTANEPTRTVSSGIQAADATGTANNAAVTVGTAAQAEAATAAGVANNATIALSKTASAEVAVAVGAVSGAALSIRASAEAATALAVALDALITGGDVPASSATVVSAAVISTSSVTARETATSSATAATQSTSTVTEG